jgi:ribosomal protein L37AE/L43A
MAIAHSTIDGIEDDPAAEPLARHHCPTCRALTLAPLGRALVTCDVCGTKITDERAFIELYARYVAVRLEVPHANSECRPMGCAEVDALITKSLAAKKGSC